MFKKQNSKIFCIGSGKTGTTSVEKAFKDLGYKVGDQVKGELFIDDYINRNFQPILNFCKTAEAFQDAPFCFKHTFIALDQYFKDAKFILTIRDTEEQWYNSLVNFHTKVHAGGQNIPTVQDLKNAEYRYQGYAWDVRSKVFGFNEHENPYDKDKFISYYNSHNRSVLDYFRFKDNLLVINLSDESSYERFCKFLNRKPIYDRFPWENQTSKK